MPCEYVVKALGIVVLLLALGISTLYFSGYSTELHGYIQRFHAQTAVNSNGRASSARENNVTHIIYFLADDLGWSDVGYHDSVIRTPTIDRLASEGVKLEKFYVNAVCTPSRSALMSGRYVTHTGLQHLHIEPFHLNGLPLGNVLFPELLRSYGYKTYMVGKWHLGFYRPEYTPERRGFDKFFGIYPGHSGHVDRRFRDKYCLVENGKPYWENTTYDSHLYAQKAIEYVEQHLQSYPEKPIFMFVSFQAVHQPLSVPTYYSDRYEHLKGDRKRQIIAGMATAMDEAIKNITDVFKQRGIWNNTVMFFSTDNGGYTPFGSNNTPLRSGKASLYEGGVRGVAFARGKGIKPGRVSHSLMHITDIFPTIMHLAARANAHYNCTCEAYVKTLDGYNIWDTISEDAPSPRTEILLNIDPKSPRWGESLFPKIYDTGLRSAIIHDRWKLLTGFVESPFVQIYYPPEKDIDKILNKTRNVRLYDLDSDPNERNDLFFKKPEIVEKLLKRLRYHLESTVNPSFPGIRCEPCFSKYMTLKYMVPFM